MISNYFWIFGQELPNAEFYFNVFFVSFKYSLECKMHLFSPLHVCKRPPNPDSFIQSDGSSWRIENFRSLDFYNMQHTAENCAWSWKSKNFTKQAKIWSEIIFVKNGFKSDSDSWDPGTSNEKVNPYTWMNQAIGRIEHPFPYHPILD